MWRLIETMIVSDHVIISPLLRATWENQGFIDRKLWFYAGTSQQKRRRIAVAKVWDVDSEQEEHSLSLSQHSSPSQSDQEQTPGQKANFPVMDSQRYHWFKQINKSPSYCQLDNIPSNNTVLKNITQRSVHLIENQPKDEQYLHVDEDRKGARHTQHLVDICFHILEFHSAEIFFSYYL